MLGRTMRLGLLIACAFGVGAAAQQAFMPAAFQSGEIPTLTVLSAGVGGGEVLVELTVGSNGAVSDARPLRTTPSFTERVVASTSGWRFSPAEAMVEVAAQRPGQPLTHPIESRVLVAAEFRPPTFVTPTLGEPITDVATAREDVPFPTQMVTPIFPVTALNPGVVLIEARVNGSGAVIGAVVKQSAPGFDTIALDAARQWRFRPARVGGAFVPSLVYIIFGFPMPVTSGEPPVCVPPKVPRPGETPCVPRPVR